MKLIKYHYCILVALASFNCTKKETQISPNNVQASKEDGISGKETSEANNGNIFLTNYEASLLKAKMPKKNVDSIVEAVGNEQSFSLIGAYNAAEAGRIATEVSFNLVFNDLLPIRNRALDLNSIGLSLVEASVSSSDGGSKNNLLRLIGSMVFNSIEQYALNDQSASDSLITGVIDALSRTDANKDAVVAFFQGIGDSKTGNSIGSIITSLDNLPEEYSDILQYAGGAIEESAGNVDGCSFCNYPFDYKPIITSIESFSDEVCLIDNDDFNAALNLLAEIPGECDGSGNPADPTQSLAFGIKRFYVASGFLAPAVLPENFQISNTPPNRIEVKNRRNTNTPDVVFTNKVGTCLYVRNLSTIESVNCTANEIDYLYFTATNVAVAVVGSPGNKINHCTGRVPPNTGEEPLNDQGVRPQARFPNRQAFSDAWAALQAAPEAALTNCTTPAQAAPSVSPSGQ